MEVIETLANFAGQPINRQVLMNILKDYRRPHDKISELVRQSFLVHVKRGVFIPGPRTKLAVPENFLLANHLWGPSYVSSDSALWHWGLIPERVYEIVSMTTNLAKIYKTPVARFRYIKLPLPYYSLGIQMVELASSQMALVAAKEKALCDKIITTQRLKLRSVKQTRQYLIEDLRISRENLRELDLRLIDDYVKDAPKQESISILIKTLRDI